MGVAYAIVKGKARLGALVHKKTATAVALTEVRPEDKQELAALVSVCKANNNDKVDEIRRSWGGNVMVCIDLIILIWWNWNPFTNHNLFLYHLNRVPNLKLKP